MWLIDKFKAVLKKMFGTQAQRVYPAADNQLSSKMADAIGLWRSISEGTPPWLDADDDIETLNFGNFIAKKAASLVTLDIDVKVEGSVRAVWLQDRFDKLISKTLRDKVQAGLTGGGIILEPTTDSINCIEDKDYVITDSDSDGNVLGVIIRDIRHANDKVYTRYEWNYLGKDGKCYILNRAYVSDNENEEGKEISLSVIEDWKELQRDTVIERSNGEPFERPLFAYFKNPQANIIDPNSAYGVAIFADAVTALKGLDIAWSRNDAEVDDSKHITFVPEEAVRYDELHNPQKKLPRFIRGIESGIDEGSIHEHVPTLLTESRWKDINNRLSIIGTLCGFSQGAFGIDKQTGMITATQVEADDRDTIQTIKDIRDALKSAINDLIYALNIIADLYKYAPAGSYETVFNFGDITYNYEEDRANWWNYVVQGKIPAWKFFEKFEGMTREEYEELQKDLNKPKTMFDDEE